MAEQRQYGAGGRLILEAAGEITVDRNGLWSGSARFRFLPEEVGLVPTPGTQNPYLWFLLAERSRIIMTPGLWTAVVEYAGIQEDVSEAQYELSPGVGMDPIETHDKFASSLAGTPSAPKPGAVFVDPKTGIVTKDNTPGKYRFEEFAPILADGSKNPLGGVKGYYVANNTVWTKSWTQKAKPSGATRTLMITSSPPGNPPQFGSCNWLEHPVAYVKRGGAYSCVQRWLLSDENGWNQLIYPSA